MSDFKMFMVGNATDETVDYVATKRMGTPILDKNGKPTGEIEPAVWKIKAIDSGLDEAIRKECTSKVPIKGKRGAFRDETDMDKYLGKLCVACTDYPNLNDAELQDFYGVKSADELLKKMLKAGEYIEYKAKVMEVNGFDVSMEELVDDAKN